MSNNIYTLDDFNKIAYEFAIRNPHVIQLLELPLTDDVVKELLSFGINATSVYFSDGNEEIIINSLQELYLDYDHLKQISHIPHSPYGEGEGIDEITEENFNHFRGHRLLIHPLSKKPLYKKENEFDAMTRISGLIETRGKKLQRLMHGEVFEHYDAVVFKRQTRYSLDPTKNTSKTIKADLEFVQEWINQKKYLQLLPNFIKTF